MEPFNQKINKIERKIRKLNKNCKIQNLNCMKRMKILKNGLKFIQAALQEENQIAFKIAKIQDLLEFKVDLSQI